MSDLTATRDHCRRMANGGHTEECPAARPKDWRVGWARRASVEEVLAARRGDAPWPEPPCTCATDADRALFQRLADELDAYLAGDLCGVCGEPAAEYEGDLFTVTEVQECRAPLEAP